MGDRWVLKVSEPPTEGRCPGGSVLGKVMTAQQGREYGVVWPMREN